MSETLITCPSCGHRFPVSEALGSQLRAEIETRVKAEHEARLQRAVEQARASAQESLSLELKDLKSQLAERERKASEAQKAVLDARKKARELEEQSKTLEQRVRAEVQESLRREGEERIKVAVAQAEARSRDESEKALKLLQEQLAEQQRKVQEAQAAELSLRKQKQALEERQRELDLEVARKLDAGRQRLEETIRKTIGEEVALKVKEKEKQIDDLRKALEDAKRRSELGSQELQGEVLELDIQAALEQQFPQDVTHPIAKGARGADLIQEVRNHLMQACGSIVWEAKNTKHWQPAWLDKLKKDQRAAGASVAVLVSAALPDGVGEFAQINGVWVTGLRTWPALAVALREQLIQVAFARSASEGKNEKMELLYRYLSGDDFRHRVESIVEAFTALQQQLQKERRSMERLWAEREKQIQRVMSGTVGMYGDLQGLVGASLPTIAALELDSKGEDLVEDKSEP